MISQKTFSFGGALFSLDFYLWSREIYVLLVMIVNLRIFHFYDRRKICWFSVIFHFFFFREESFIPSSVRIRAESFRWDSMMRLICWFSSFFSLAQTSVKTEIKSWGGVLKINSRELENEWLLTKPFWAFIMMALDVASLNPFLMSANYWQPFFRRRFFSWAAEQNTKKYRQQEHTNGYKIIMLNSPLNVLWNDFSSRTSHTHLLNSQPSPSRRLNHCCEIFASTKKTLLNFTPTDWNIEWAKIY